MSSNSAKMPDYSPRFSTKNRKIRLGLKNGSTRKLKGIRCPQGEQNAGFYLVGGGGGGGGGGQEGSFSPLLPQNSLASSQRLSIVCC